MNGFQIMVRSGPDRGLTWVITDRPFIIGRDIDCDIVIADPLVSRHHCELVQSGEHVQIRDLNSRNATLVNGRCVQTCPINPGDEISVGSISFVLNHRLLGSEQSPPVPSTESTQCFIHTKTVSPTSTEFDSWERGLPRNVEDLMRLFQVSRFFTMAESIAELVGLFESAVRERFTPLRCWIALAYGDTLETIVRPETDPNEPDFALSLMKKTMDNRQGSLLSRPSLKDSSVALSTMTAPIYIRQQTIGVVTVENTADARTYEENDLEFLMGLAHAVAPFFGSIEHRRHLEQEIERFRVERQKSMQFIGASDAAKTLQYLIRVVARSNQPILVLGETGSGKELVASLIHELSERHHAPFVPVNCAAIPNELFESEVFGHEKGAFTGATERKIGLLEQSNHGTLFLDEIADLTLQNQARILRAVELGRFRRVGGNKEIQVEFRVIAATNKNLQEAIQANNFREDLYHRLRGLEVRVPPLRERASDIAELANYFLEGARRDAKRPLRGFTEDALEYMRKYPWPGNIRELKHTITAAATLAQGDLIDLHDIKGQALPSAPVKAPLSLAEMEKEHIIQVLDFCKGNMTDAAKHLGIGRSTLYEKLSSFGINR